MVAAATPPSEPVLLRRVEYRVGPQDRLLLRVHSLKRNTSDVFAWAPLNAEFTVGPTGTLPLPLIGELPVSEQSPAEIAEAIAARLKQVANLTETPVAAVEIVRYRPFYIAGAVQQPGRYEYQPGLTVLQALSIAQGVVRPTDVVARAREAIVLEGEIRQLETERIALELKQARLEAEIEEADTIKYPPTLPAVEGNPSIKRLFDDESRRLRDNRQALADDLDALERMQTMYRSEIVALNQKEQSLTSQAAIVKDEVTVTTKLYEKGLTAANRERSVRQALLATENSNLDVQIARLRAAQSLAQSKREMAEIIARYRRTVLDELAATERLHAANRSRHRTAVKILTNAEVRSAELLVREPSLTYRLTRSTASGSRVLTVVPDTRLEPGDVIEVVRSVDSRWARE